MQRGRCAASISVRQGGTVQVHALCDAAGTFPEPLEAAFPGSELHGPWRLHVHCYLVRAGAATVLVDAGTGPAWAPATRWFDRPGRLISELEASGVTPGSITHVVLTHLHLDHVGWVVHGSAEHPEPTFPNASHLVQRVELDPRRLGGLHASHVRPLLEAGLLDAVDGPAEPVPGIRLVPTPGHTAGHQSVYVDSGDEQLIISGDVFVHPLQVADPTAAYLYEDHADQAERSRRAVLADSAERPTVLAPAHFDATLAVLDVSASGAGSLRVRARCDRADR
jgi:glyoxylase-like metal-dependent hydrolase (beta-lactamase superfamily II)